MTPDWWRDYFDEVYYILYKPLLTEERTAGEVDFIAEALALKPGELVLDLACGQGRHSIPLTSRGYQVVGLDYSPYLLELAKKFSHDAGVEPSLIRGDMRVLPFSRCFDAVYIFFTSFGYFSDEDNIQVLREVRRALKPGGRFLLDLWNPFKLAEHPNHQAWYLYEDMLVLEERNFDVRTFRTFSRTIIYHRGRVIKERSFVVRSYSLPELSWLLKECGFEVKDVYGGYDKSFFTRDSKRLIVIAEAR